tara:strand:+ start:4152 stop:4997 length:846 start_codon:yes stop_codon:yes gene_type:complete
MKKIKTTKIGKKEYVEVDERIRLFWELHPNWTILTEMVYNCEENLVCIFKCKIIDENDVIKATGHAREFQADKKSMVNKTSHVENCETSAIGRALGIKGIITEYGIASADEVRNAIQTEKEMDSSLNKIVADKEAREAEQDKVIKIVTDAAKKKVEDEKSGVDIASDYASTTLTKNATDEQLASITGKKVKQTEIDELEEELSTNNAEQEQEYLVDLNKRVSMCKSEAEAKALAKEGREWTKDWSYKKSEYGTLYKCITESFSAFKKSQDAAKAAASKGGA